MAPAALSAPVLRISPHSAGRAAAAAALAGGLRFGRTTCLPAGIHSGKAVLPLRSNELLRPVGQRRPSALRSSLDDSKATDNKVEFGYSRKDVLLIGVGVTLLGYGLKSGLEFVGVDPLQAGNVVQLFIVLGMTVGWISSYMIRVANKDMTYATQLRNYEKQVMEKRLESLSEVELQVLLEQVEQEKERLPPRRDQGSSLGIEFSYNRLTTRRPRGLQIMAGKAALCLTKRSRSRKSLARVHGFRRRMRTTAGRKVLKRRRARGRKILCTKTNSPTGTKF